MYVLKKFMIITRNVQYFVSFAISLHHYLFSNVLVLLFQQELREAESFQERISVGDTLKKTEEKQRAKIKKSSYFSDEEELSDS